MRKKILFIGGSLNQTKMAHAAAKHLENEYDCYYTAYYADGFLGKLAEWGLADFCPLGGNFRRMTEAYFVENNLKVDFAGKQHDYDLYVTTSDLLVQRNLRGKKVILIQEGMTDPENLMYHMVRLLKLPRWMASTSTNGLSQAYDYFCVASEGYRDFFIKKGIRPDKLVVTGIPNFDNIAKYRINDFPYRNFVLVATSDARETFKFDNRKAFIAEALEIANGRPIIFKLHPNENVDRATREIYVQAPHALVLSQGSIEEMIANCDVLVTQYSTVVYNGIALGKEVHSYFDVEMLKRMVPQQNGGTSGRHIAQVCRDLVEGVPVGAPAGAFAYGNV